MSKRRLPQSFVCKGCDQAVVLNPHAYDTRTMYCSRACKVRAFIRNHPDRKAEYSRREQAKVAPARAARIAAREAREKGTCAMCSAPFLRSGNRLLTCSRRCQYALIHQTNTGKKHRPHKSTAFICSACHQPSTSHQRTTTTCARCMRRVQRRNEKTLRRARKRGVAWERISVLRVLARDKWQCQLCGCATPARLRGQMVDNAPELDHIVPLSAGGGHTWANVQCACRKCNYLKAGKPMGQLRLAV